MDAISSTSATENSESGSLEKNKIMLHRVSETTMHRVRWLLTIGWLLLIASMFYDPITPAFTVPGSGTPFSLHPEVYLDPARCVKIREQCLPEQPYSMTVLMWWAMIVPAGIFILLVLGHEFWRRICPLSFLSQIPRALGLQRKRKVINPITQEFRCELVTIGENSWLGRNHLYVQFSLFVLGLGLRILFVNGHRASLGFFLIFTIACAILVGYLYAGKSWCQYFCPMAPVQMVYTGPRSLLGSQAHLQERGTITQSTCRVVDASGVERSNCVGCKSNCIDIDAEQSYWQELKKPGRRLIQYGYLGMVIAFYFYYYLYSGNWDYYFSGAWTHEEDLLTKLFHPGFYINGHAIHIPKLVAVYLTYFVFTAATFWLGLIVEKLYHRCTVWHGYPATAEQTQHATSTLFSLVSFWTFFSYGARPSLNRLPSSLVLGFNALVVIVGAIWIYRTWQRTRTQYERERVSRSLRRQLVALNLDPQTFRQPLDEMTPDEVYVLVKILPNFTHQLRLQAYTAIVGDLIEEGLLSPDQSFEALRELRSNLQLRNQDYTAAIQTLANTRPELFETPKPKVDLSATTIARPIPQRNQATATVPITNRRSRYPDERTGTSSQRTPQSPHNERTTPLRSRNSQHR
jgi:hypothetical protein